MTGRRALVKDAALRLARAGVASPEYDAAELLAHVLGTTRANLPLSDTVDDAQAKAFEELVRRREAREPLQHLVGSAAFQRRLKALRAAPLVDYAGAGRAKLEVLELLFREATHSSARVPKGMRDYALFEALREKFGGAWQTWPEAFREASEAFITGTSAGVWAIESVDDHPLPGAPGPVSRALGERFARVASGRDPAFEHWLAYASEGGT